VIAPKKPPIPTSRKFCNRALDPRPGADPAPIGAHPSLVHAEDA
jgi:hypothetical protein